MTVFFMVGDMLDTVLGASDGMSDGEIIGLDDGNLVEAIVDMADGFNEGSILDTVEGLEVGDVVGVIIDGLTVGQTEGTKLGD